MKYVSIQIVLADDGSYTIEIYNVFSWGKELIRNNKYATEKETLEAYQLEHQYYFKEQSPYWSEPSKTTIGLQIVGTNFKTNEVN